MLKVFRKLLEWSVGKYQSWDPLDPVGRAKRRYAMQACSWSVTALVLCLMLLMSGVPHLQLGKYQHYGMPEANGWVSSRKKISANYLGITGWKNVQSQEFQQEGCPYLLFIPVGECLFGGE